MVIHDFASENYLLAAVKLTRTGYLDKYKYSICDIGFDARRGPSLSHGLGLAKT